MFKWLFQKPVFYQYPDTFGFNQTTVDDAVRQAIVERQKQNDVVLVVCHFPDWFERVQTTLDSWGVDFQITTNPITRKWLGTLETDDGQVFLTLSQMFDVDETMPDTIGNDQNSDRQLSMIVLERHPIISVDDQLCWFARNSGMRTKMGYYLCFDHPLLDRCFGQNEQQLLKHWTSIDDIVFSSALASRRIQTMIKSKFAKSRLYADAQSMEEWFKLNEQ